jgi:hypothetical protein
MTAGQGIGPRLRTGLAWDFFVGALLLATAPVWCLWAFGFSPALDEGLQLSICGGPLKK